MWPFSRKKQPAERKEPTFQDNLENPATPITQEQLAFTISGAPTMAGPTVNEASSIRSVDVFRCVSIMAGIASSLDLDVFHITTKGRELAPSHRFYPLLNSQPNENTSAYIWRELMMVNLLLWGNHYSQIEFDGAGRMVGFTPLAPWKVNPFRDKSNGLIRYHMRRDDDGFDVIPAAKMIHVPGLGFDGVRGISVISAVGRQAIGTALAMEEFTARLHANGVRPSGIGKPKEGISPAAFRRMKQQFEELYAGSGNAGRTLWVDAGTEWTQMQISPADAETLASRRFSTAQICNIFGVPAMLLNENADMTAWGSGIEQIMIGFLMTTINPWLKRIESELNRKLFQNSNYRTEFDREGLIVLDSKSKAELFSKLVTGAMMTPNEGRRKLNLPDDPDGNRLFIQGAMVPIELAGAHLQQQPEPAEPGADQGGNGQ